MSKIIIRNATNADSGQIQQIYAYSVLNGLGTFEEIPPSLEDMAKRMHGIKELEYPYLVAEINNEIVGYCYANYYRQRSAYRYTVEDSVYIANGYHGQGIGRDLLAELITRCKTQGFKQMVALIGDSNNHASISLHNKLGFAHVGKFSNAGFKFGQWVDVVFMQLEL